MKIGFIITFLAMTVKGFETSGDGSTDSDTVVDNVIKLIRHYVSNIVNIVINSETNCCQCLERLRLMCRKCNSLPNTECKIVKSNSNGYTCPCIAGFELDNAGQCIEETVSVNTVRVTTDQVTNQETTSPTTVQADVTFPTEQNNPEKSTPNSGSVLTSIAGISVVALFL